MARVGLSDSWYAWLPCRVASLWRLGATYEVARATRKVANDLATTIEGIGLRSSRSEHPSKGFRSY